MLERATAAQRGSRLEPGGAPLPGRPWGVKRLLEMRRSSLDPIKSEIRLDGERHQAGGRSRSEWPAV